MQAQRGSSVERDKRPGPRRMRRVVPKTRLLPRQPTTSISNTMLRDGLTFRTVIDSGAPVGSSDYTTVVLAHGLMWSSGEWIRHAVLLSSPRLPQRSRLTSSLSPIYRRLSATGHLCSRTQRSCYRVQPARVPGLRALYRCRARSPRARL